MTRKVSASARAVVLTSVITMIAVAAGTQQSDAAYRLAVNPPALTAPAASVPSPYSRATALAATSSYSGSVRFLPLVTYDAGAPCSNSVAVADVNLDGIPDLIVANGCADINDQGVEGSVSILLGKGSGTFRSAVQYDSGGVQASAVSVVDLNGDGKPDLVVANECSTAACPTGVVAVLFGNGDGTFESPVTYAAGGNPWSLAIGDVNHDGKTDVVVVGDGDPTCPAYFGVLIGNGNGSFQPATVNCMYGIYTQSVVLSDVNGDGKLDMIMGVEDGSQTSQVSVSLGNGDGTFQPLVLYPSDGKYPASVAVADVNGDGKPDILAANPQSNYLNDAEASVGVLLGHGDGTFENAVTYPTGADDAVALAVADVNSDSAPDVIVAHCTQGTKTGFGCPGYGGGRVSVLLGNGDGTFRTPLVYASGGSSASAVAVADVNIDGQQDLVVANHYKTGTSGLGTIGVILSAKAATSTSLSSSLNPSIYGQKVTFTARVATPVAIPPTGIVGFEWGNGAYRIGGAPLDSNGVATFSISLLNADPYSLAAVYPGDVSHFGSTSPIVNQIVLPTVSTARLTSSLNPSRVGQAVTFIAKISSPTVIAKGQVTFWKGKTALGTVQLASGTAKLVVSTLPAGSSVIKVNYEGNSNIKGSSASVTQIVH